MTRRRSICLTPARGGPCRAEPGSGAAHCQPDQDDDRPAGTGKRGRPEREHPHPGQPDTGVPSHPGQPGPHHRPAGRGERPPPRHALRHAGAQRQRRGQRAGQRRRRGRPGRLCRPDERPGQPAGLYQHPLYLPPRPVRSQQLLYRPGYGKDRAGLPRQRYLHAGSQHGELHPAGHQSPPGPEHLLHQPGCSSRAVRTTAATRRG